jgi:hypothetical protein
MHEVVRHVLLEQPTVAPWRNRHAGPATGETKETLRKWLAEVPELSLVRQVDHLAVMRIS